MKTKTYYILAHDEIKNTKLCKTSQFSSKKAAANEIRCNGWKVSRVWNDAEFGEKVTGKTFWWRDVIEQEAADYLEQCGTLEF